jgi:polyphosphate kinase
MGAASSDASPVPPEADSAAGASPDPSPPDPTETASEIGASSDEAPPAEAPPDLYVNREISWLAFNGRVLQEAMDPRVPLYDRLCFLAIFYSNLDEFFRVRVASLRSLLRLKKKKLKSLDFRPGRLLREIHFIVTSQQETFGRAFRGEILPELESNGIFLLHHRNLLPVQTAFLRHYFHERVLAHLTPQVLEDKADAPFLKEGRVYLVAELWPGIEVTLASERPSYGILEVPCPPLPRFVVVPGEGLNVLFLEDAIRLCLSELYPRHEVGSAYAVKLSRDAELYLEDEFQGDLVEKIRESLRKRETGLPARFLYDLQAPYALISFMKEHLDLEEEDLVPGGRYHNLQDLFHFPRLPQHELLVRAPLPPLAHPTLGRADSILAAVAKRDRLLHFPYQSYRHTVRFLEEASRDPDVDRIWITLYRVAEDSSVVRTLMEAARSGISVTAFVEVKARFDEARNLKWAAEMEEAGVRTVYSKPGIKVHAKLALVSRLESGARRQYAYLATGNFNETTALVYADHALLTADPRLTRDVEQVFRYLWEEIEVPECSHLLVAPFTLRGGILERIRAEIDECRRGGISGLVWKVNGLEDKGIIDALYEAGSAGVRTDLIVRGICRMRPGLPGYADHVRARSILDRFLEHGRILRFANGGRATLFLSSADMMRRNLDHRVEVAFPVYDALAKGELEYLLHLQLADNTKARALDPDQMNNYVGRGVGEPRVEAQEGFYRWLEEGLGENLEEWIQEP